MTPAPVFAALLVLTVGNGEVPDDCKRRSSHHEAVVTELTNALRAYERCVLASRGRDPCTGEYEDLDVAQDKFETAVADGRGCPRSESGQ